MVPRRLPILVLAIVAVVAGCRAPSATVETRLPLAVQVDLEPSELVCRSLGVAGDYRLESCRGAGRLVASGAGARHPREPLSVPVAGLTLPADVDRLQLLPAARGEVLLLLGDQALHGLRVVAGSWQEFAAGRGTVELALTADSWQRWQRGIRDRFQQQVERHGQAGGVLAGAGLPRARVDAVVLPPPRFRAGPRRLVVRFGPGRLAGEVLVARPLGQSGPDRRPADVAHGGGPVLSLTGLLELFGAPMRR